MKKRGMSTVVTTLIIVLLVMVAIGVVWVVIANLIAEGVKDIGLQQFTIDLEKVAMEVSGSNLIITVKRNSGKGDLVGIKFIVSNNTNTQLFERPTNMKELETETFTLSLTEVDPDSITEVSMAPIYKTSSGEEKTGNAKPIGGKEIILPIEETLGPELLLNTGFETWTAGVPDNWIRAGFLGSIDEETTLVHSGGSAARLTVGWDAYSEALGQAFSVTAGNTYRYSFWTRGDGTNNGAYSVYNINAGNFIISPTPTGISGTTYTQVNIDVVAPVGSTQMRIWVYAPNVNGGTAYFDDVSVKQVN